MRCEVPSLDGPSIKESDIDRGPSRAVRWMSEVKRVGVSGATLTRDDVRRNFRSGGGVGILPWLEVKL